ncbi:O-antigen ligase family protein [Paenibacillus sp. F411]|uniref:O-antigen ligase family protein n=1 Tax=Paenibacillus sp. F411 TaxID=2820239 RepID=UPI001AB0062E|nr:O-antigen ligase family protein [Paenibacillus sp. F411]MBO2943796.1 O-antigen ligase family protein [Paenibacillus sp. F411]
MEDMERIFGLSRALGGTDRVLGRLVLASMVLFIAVMTGLAGSTGSLHMRLIELCLLFISMLVALHIHFKSPQALLPYALTMWVFSPEIRRFLDWSFRSYTETSLISLIPYTVSLVMLIPVIPNIKHLDRRIGLVIKLIGAALVYGFAIGFWRYGLSSVFDLLNYVVPFLVLVYVHLTGFSRKTHDQWLRSFSCLAVLVAAYGIYQYMVLPPWDHFWMTNAEMNSIGIAEPQRFRLFSLLNSPGPAGVFLAVALAVMVVQKKWRVFGYAGILLVAFALLLTLVRVGWIACAVMIMAYFFRSKMKNRLQLLILAAILLLAYQFILPVLPGSSQVVSRLDTFSALEDDHSFNERLLFSKHIFTTVLSNPVGMGLGSSGLGAKLTQNDTALIAFDNGYLNIFYTFGVFFGTVIIIFILYLLVSLFKSSKLEKLYTPLSFSIVCVIIFLMMASNVLRGLSGFVLLLLLALSFTYVDKPSDQKNNGRSNIAYRIPRRFNN